MLASSQPRSPFDGGPSLSTSRSTKRPGTKEGEKAAIWVPMLNGASKGKDLAEKQLLVLGGTPDQQREFLDTLNPDTVRPRYGRDQRRSKIPPVSNRYALGYTYHDVLDADQEDILARLNIYLLSNPSSAFAPLLRPLLTKKTVPDTLIAILLDWSDPFTWPRQLRQWIRLLRSVIVSLDEDTKIEMEETMTAWKERRIGPDAPNTTTGSGTTAEPKAPVAPLRPGEWEEGLGVPLSVVCVHTEKIERLERDYGWQEEQFDFLMQWLRTIILKHGGSLVYTTNYDPNHVRTLIHSSLGIQSLLKRETAKHNVIDRDKILIPPNWDSWGKIRILKDGFDPEAVGNAWSVEIQQAPLHTLLLPKDDPDQPGEEQSAVAIVEAVLSDPTAASGSYHGNGVNAGAEEVVTAPDTQTFLAAQLAVLDQLKVEDEKAGRRARKGAPAPTGSGVGDVEDVAAARPAPVQEQIGPYQVNVNGIDFDAEEATRRIREREAERRGEKDTSRLASGVTTPRTDRVRDAGEGDAGKQSNEALQSFFSNLMKKGKGGAASGTVSPTRGSPAPERQREREMSLG